MSSPRWKETSTRQSESGSESDSNKEMKLDVFAKFLEATHKREIENLKDSHNKLIKQMKDSYEKQEKQQKEMKEIYEKQQREMKELYEKQHREMVNELKQQLRDMTLERDCYRNKVGLYQGTRGGGGMDQSIAFLAAVNRSITTPSLSLAQI